ncbi:hypothetical protein ACWDAZ_36445 [Streptomyces sp. NPDC001215]
MRALVYFREGEYTIGQRLILPAIEWWAKQKCGRISPSGGP